MVEAVTYVPPGRHQTFKPQPGITLHLLHGSAQYQVFLLEVEPGTHYESAPHDGEELRYVVKGAVTFTVAGRDHAVPAGGTLRHPSTAPHSFRTDSASATFVTFALSCGYAVSQLLEGPAGYGREEP